jgi:hypothetical protein
MRCLWLLLFLLPASPALSAGVTWPISDMPRFYILGEGNYHLSADGTYFYTKENYDSIGQVNQPSQMEHVRYGNLRLHTAFGFTPRVSIFAQADIRGLFMVNSRGSNISDDENYGLGDAFLGFRWLLYRSKYTDKVYPTEWAPETWLALLEGTWLFPMYDRAKTNAPPLGNQSNDFTAMGRLVWYAADWLGIAGNLGYTHRTAGYEAGMPWGLRADLNFTRSHYWRFWVNYQSYERLGTESGSVLNPEQPDPFTGGSYLFKSDAPVLRSVQLGAAYLLSKEWEIAGGPLFTTSGINSAKGVGGSLALSWRPYQVPELRYEEYRKQQLKKLEQEPQEFRQRAVVSYGIRATVLKVSAKANYLKIAYGQLDGLKAGDLFQIFPPDDFSNTSRMPIGIARIEVARERESFLRVDQRFDASARVQPGYEVRRIILEE